MVENEYSLYIHIPFCAQKCDYCAFYSVPLCARSGASEIVRSYLDVLIFDIHSQIEHFSVSYIPSIYIGGGTPSVIPPKEAAFFFDALQRLLPNKPLEWTVEVNPESVNADFLHICKEYGVTRISAGVQTFNQKLRQSIDRAGRVEDVHKSLKCIADIYGSNFSCDIICGLPGTNPDILKNDIYQLLRYKPLSVSFYDLTVEEDTPLAKKIKAGKLCLPSVDMAEEMWLLGRDMLRAAGYEQYEVSNFALAGGRCEHNVRYWRMRPWLGAGPAASGTIIYDTAAGICASPVKGIRRVCVPDVAAYLKTGRGAFPALYEREELSAACLLRESLMMGFRYIEGPDTALFERRFGITPAALIPKTLDLWRKQGLARPDIPALTTDGLALQNRFLHAALEEADKTLEKD